jgi:cytoskeleton protein RodZ
MSEAAVAAGPSAGALLRQAREAAGLHVAALAVSLKVPVRKLEALEDDRYEQLTDAVFARALASSVCRTLKVDPKPILDRLPQTTAPRLVQDHEGIGAPFRAPGDAAPPGWREYLRRPVVLAVGGLLVGAVAILLLPNLSNPSNLNSEAPAAAASKPETTEVALAASAGVPAGAPAEPLVAPVDAGAVPGSMIVTPVAIRPQPNAALAAAVPASAPVAAVPAVDTAPAPPATGIVVFKASGPSWVEVVDKQGNVALRRLLAAGESAGASGTLPLAVTVGSVNTTAVEVRGKPFDLGKMSRDNVARFEIK